MPSLRAQNLNLRIYRSNIRVQNPSLRAQNSNLRIHRSNLRVQNPNLRVQNSNLRIHRPNLRVHNLSKPQGSKFESSDSKIRTSGFKKFRASGFKIESPDSTVSFCMYCLHVLFINLITLLAFRFLKSRGANCRHMV